MVAAAVRLPKGPLPALLGVKDSKKLSPKRREALFEVIRREAVSVGVGWASPEEIDRDNILRATFCAMRRALERISIPENGLVLIDGNAKIPAVTCRQEALVSGDNKSLCIAAASVIAKVVRDRWLCVLDRRHPGYGFAQHKGYGTAAHYEALERLGRVGGLHRNSFLRNLREHPLPVRG